MRNVYGVIAAPEAELCKSSCIITLNISGIDRYHIAILHTRKHPCLRGGIGRIEFDLNAVFAEHSVARPQRDADDADRYQRNQGDDERTTFPVLVKV